MLESVMEELISKYPMDFFPRKSLTLKGRQGAFAGVGRFDLLFTDEHQTNILMELKARPAKYEDASQLAKYNDALKQQGKSHILMWLVATSIPNSVREFLDRIGIEYTEIHETEYRRVAEQHGEIVEASILETIERSTIRPERTNDRPAPTSRSSFRTPSKISRKFRESMGRLNTFFPAALQFLTYIESNSCEGFWINSVTNAHLYYQNSFLAFIQITLDTIRFSPMYHIQIDGGTVDRHRLIFPDVFRRLTMNEDGSTFSWARFPGDGSVVIGKQAPQDFFMQLLAEIKKVHANIVA